MAKASLTKRTNPRVLVILFALFGVVVVGALAFVISDFFSQSGTDTPSTEIVAWINGEPITSRELEQSYAYAVPEHYKQFVGKWQFLNESVIPQKLLLQEAKRKGYSSNEKEANDAIASLLYENNLTGKQLEANLLRQGLRISDLAATYEARITIGRFVNATILPGISVEEDEIEEAYQESGLEPENISLDEASPLLSQQILLRKQSEAILSLIDILRQNSSIEILLDQTKQHITSFEEADSPICTENGKIIIRMFTSKDCVECKAVSSRLSSLLLPYQNESQAAGFIWELDSGDNLMTKEKEQGVPEGEVEIFRRISPDSEVPAYSFGCKYVRVGHLPNAEGNLNAEEREFRDVMATLIVENG